MEQKILKCGTRTKNGRIYPIDLINDLCSAMISSPICIDDDILINSHKIVGKIESAECKYGDEIWITFTLIQPYDILYNNQLVKVYLCGIGDIDNNIVSNFKYTHCVLGVNDYD